MQTAIIDPVLEGHVKGQHAAAVSVQLDTDLQRRIQPHHGSHAARW